MNRSSCLEVGVDALLSRRQPLQVVFLPWSTHVGGAEAFTIRLSHVLRKRFRIDARVVAVGQPGALAVTAQDLGVPVAHLAAGNDLRLVRNLPYVRRSLLQLEPDVVVALGYDLFLPALLLPGPLAPVVVSDPGGALLNAHMRGRGLRRFKPYAVRRVCAGRVAAEVAVSQHMLKVQQALPHASRLVCIPNGVDTAEFIPAQGCAHEGKCQEASVVVVAAGRLIEDKGFLTLVSACRLAARMVGQPVVLRIAGTGLLAGELASGTQSLQAGGLRVEMAGHVSDMASFWQEGDVAAVPSSGRCHESFGLVAAEAMACGLPVVATAVGALPEVVSHGQSGRIVPPDDAEAMARALADYIVDPELRSCHGRAARDRVVREYSMEHVALEYALLFSRVCEAIA